MRAKKKVTQKGELSDAEKCSTVRGIGIAVLVMLNDRSVPHTTVGNNNCNSLSVLATDNTRTSKKS